MIKRNKILSENKLMNNKAQIAIFIILALIIVVLIILFFLLRMPPKVELIDENNPQAYIESCVREAVEESIEILSPQGGDIEPKGYVLYDNIERVYLCYNDNFYERCVNQRPLFIEYLENEITTDITPALNACFRSLEKELKKRYDVSSGEMEITTELYHNQLIIKIKKDLDMVRDDEKRSFKKFEMHMIHPIYNFAEISMEIVNQETRYCNFDLLGYMILYPRYDIKRIITGESNIIYNLKDRRTNEEFTFAVRNCILPPGVQTY